MSKARIIRSEEKEWLHTWGTKTNVVEKRLLTKEDGFPISYTLRRIPAQQRVVSAEGYKIHSHSAHEFGYMIKGHSRSYLEGVGEVERKEGALICNPAGTKHAAMQTFEDTLLAVIYYPPYAKTEGPTEEGVAPPGLKGELRIIRAEDKEWIRPWGPKSNVREKRYLTKEDGFPIGFLLRFLPAREDVESGEGYKLHSHPSLEIGYVLKGGNKVYNEALGEVEMQEGMLICNPAGTKHGAISVVRDTLIAVVNIPPLSRLPTIVDKPGAPEEG